jgi:DNA-binding response OmpR family regulator
MKVLLADGDVGALTVTASGLRRQGLTILPAADGAQAFHRWQSEQPDVVVADVELPRMSGYDLCRVIRDRAETPVILLSSTMDDALALRAFHLGADDYVLKPFSLPLLALRIRAVVRRGVRMAGRADNQEIRIGELVVDVESHEVRNGGMVTRLTPTEFRLLELLASSPGRVVRAARLVEYVWGYAEHDVSLLKTHISHVRQKLGMARGGPPAIEAVPSVGYRLERRGALRTRAAGDAVARISPEMGRTSPRLR